jgi:hypothetical protein
MATRVALKARFEHNREVWEATVGENLRLIGKYVRKPRLGTVLEPASGVSSTKVVRIVPERPGFDTDGKGEWDPHAQVHELTVLQWGDG